MSGRDHPPVPAATYRLQLTPTFGFAEAAGVLDHVVRLGVSHLYLSPIAEAVPGSTHGYDVVDHRRVRAELGGIDGLRRLLDQAGALGVGVVIDHVPNHVSAAAAELNEPWWNALRDGPDSDAARWFDVDWAAGDGRILVPKLGDPLDDVVDAGRLEVGDGERGPELRVGSLRFPLRAGTEHLAIADVVRAQHYELMWWRDPRRNVRRFFTIDDLVAVRVEDPSVAEVVDIIPTLLTDHPAFAGVRVDHVDGLADPTGYLRQLRERIGDDRLLFVEKILAPGEHLPASWPVDGTTGYEHIRIVEHTFLDPTGERALTRQWNEATGDERSFEDWEAEGRRQVLDGGLAPDLDRFVRVAMGAAGGRAGSADRLRLATIELTIGLHRYRTYFPDDPDAGEQLGIARQRAVAARPDLADDVDALVELIAADPAVATRWQQLTSPVMAKGAEDRAFYRYLRLASLCEVGGAPGDFTVDDAAFHDHQREMQRRSPLGLNAGTTHDTKRSEGVRARSLALAEIADDWTATVDGWRDAHPELVARLDPATILLALQTAVTAWPLEAQRLGEYLRKSAREAELLTSWTEPDETYEAALSDLATTLADELTGPAATAAGTTGTGAGSLTEVVARVLRPGWSNSLTTLAVRIAAPGVPDLYQGTAAFTYSLVDPDNRIEPDWDARRALVAAAAGTDLAGAWGLDDPNRVDVIAPADVEMTDVAVADVHHSDLEVAKAVVITRLLALRRRRSDVFGPGGAYLPVATNGPAASRLLAFARSAPGTPAGEADVVVLAVRRSVGAGAWGGTTVALPPGTWRDVLTDDAHVRSGADDVAVEWWLAHTPVAVLERTDR